MRDGRKLELKHKIILVTRLALVSSFLFAGGVSTANQINDNPLEQTDPNYGWESSSGLYKDIPYLEQNGITSTNHFENYNHTEPKVQLANTQYRSFLAC